MAGDRKQIHVLLDEILLRQLEDYRFAHRFQSRTDAIRWLLEWSLGRNPEPRRPQDDGSEQSRADVEL